MEHQSNIFCVHFVRRAVGIRSLVRIASRIRQWIMIILTGDNCRNQGIIKLDKSVSIYQLKMSLKYYANLLARCCTVQPEVTSVLYLP